MIQSIRRPTLVRRDGVSNWLVLAILLAAVCQLFSNTPVTSPLQARLIWASDSAHSPNQKHRKLESQLTQQLRKQFRWQHFFEVERKDFELAQGTPVKLRLSPVCELEVQQTTNSQIELKLYGKGKLSSKTTGTLSAEGWLITAGDCEDQSGWFVVVKQR